MRLTDLNGTTSVKPTARAAGDVYSPLGKILLYQASFSKVNWQSNSSPYHTTSHPSISQTHDPLTHSFLTLDNLPKTLCLPTTSIISTKLGPLFIPLNACLNTFITTPLLNPAFPPPSPFSSEWSLNSDWAREEISCKISENETYSQLPGVSSRAVLDRWRISSASEYQSVSG